MGLEQKRIVKEYQDSVLPGWKKQFDEVSGEIPIEVLWETMQNDENYRKELYFDYYDKVYFGPLMKVFKDLCADAMGKDAVKAKVKKIVIDGSSGINYSASTFSDGVFTLKHKFDTNVDGYHEEDRVKGWRKMIGEKL